MDVPNKPRAKARLWLGGWAPIACMGTGLLVANLRCYVRPGWLLREVPLLAMMDDKFARSMAILALAAMIYVLLKVVVSNKFQKTTETIASMETNKIAANALNQVSTLVLALFDCAKTEQREKDKRAMARAVWAWLFGLFFAFLYAVMRVIHFSGITAVYSAIWLAVSIAAVMAQLYVGMLVLYRQQNYSRACKSKEEEDALAQKQAQEQDTLASAFTMRNKQGDDV